MEEDEIIVEDTKPDRRVQRTRQRLRKAFVTLMLEKAYDAITVQDITDSADTARVTFYRHYKDKEDLLTDWLDAVFQEIFKYITPMSRLEFLSLSKHTPILLFYKHVEQNHELYRILLTGHLAAMVRDRIQNYLAEIIAKSIHEQLPAEQPAIPLDLLAQHIAASYLGVVIWWLENDLEYSIVYLAMTTHRLNMLGVLGSLSSDSN